MRNNCETSEITGKTIKITTQVITFMRECARSSYEIFMPPSCNIYNTYHSYLRRSAPLESGVLIIN